MDACTIPVVGPLTFWALGAIGLAVGSLSGWWVRGLYQWWRRTLVGVRMAMPMVKVATYAVGGVLAVVALVALVSIGGL